METVIKYPTKEDRIASMIKEAEALKKRYGFGDTSREAAEARYAIEIKVREEAVKMDECMERQSHWIKEHTPQAKID